MDHHDVNEQGSPQRLPDVGRGSVDAVREEAMGQARSVAGAAVEQTKGVFAGVSSDLSTEAQSQKLRLAKGLDGLSAELEEVALNGSGRVPALAGEAAAQTRSLSRWLERTDPGDMLRSVEEFGRRRPVVFVLGSALAGVVAGRVTRGMIDGRSEDTDVPVPAGAVGQPAAVGVEEGTYDLRDPSGIPVAQPVSSMGSGGVYGGCHDPDAVGGR